jgi:hypothetical protein
MNREVRCTTIPVGGFQLYDYNVAPNAVGFMIETLNADGNVNLYVRPQLDPTTAPGGYAANSVNGGINNEFISFNDNIGLIQPGLWRIGVTNVDAQPVNYCVRVTEIYDTEVVTLCPNDPTNGQIVAANSIRYYTVDIINKCSSGVDFFTFDHFNTNLLIYVQGGRLPTPSDFYAAGVSDGDGSADGASLSPPYPKKIYYIAVINTNPVPVTFTIVIAGQPPCDAGCGAPAPIIATSSVSYSASGLKLAWDASPSEQYRVEYTDTLSPARWQTITNVITSDTGHFEFLDTSAQTNTAAGQRFYRLQRVQ